ncbi:MAG: hypothetical protein HYX74_06925 [Acidobacteria bacterium]|nr:hypothetical protein [Acidobacteriota bacterium]
MVRPDNFDVLTVWTNFDMGGGGAFYQFVRNDVQGIGRFAFDLSARFGSNGRMRGLVFMNDVNLWPADPFARLVGGFDSNSTISVVFTNRGT